MERLDRFIAELSKKTPGIEIKFKNESSLMKVIGKILFFNPLFMSEFITTIGKTIYFPSKDWLKSRFESSMLTVTAHEYQHVRDNVKLGILFSFLYLFPISLLPFFITLALVTSSWAVALLGLLCLAPLPAAGRTYLELRGYTMSLFAHNAQAEDAGIKLNDRRIKLTSMVDFMNDQFTSFNYYAMWPFGVKQKLLKQVDLILSDKLIETNVIYSDVRSALQASKK